jgi:hypothetical protein
MVSLPFLPRYVRELGRDAGHVVRFMARALDGCMDAVREARAIRTFVAAVQEQFKDDILGVAVGRFNGRRFVWVVVPDLDVGLSLRIHELQVSIADARHAVFEVHVAPAQGRTVEQTLPDGFELAG